MAQVKLGSEGTWFTSGEDHGKPVRYQIRPIPLEVVRRFHREIYGNTKLRKSPDQSVSLAVERMQDYTVLRAAYALVNTENFSVEASDPATANELGRLLGGVKVEAGGEVALDGKWTDELKEQVLRAAPQRAAWIAKKATEISEAAIKDEEEEAEGF